MEDTEMSGLAATHPNINFNTVFIDVLEEHKQELVVIESRIDRLNKKKKSGKGLGQVESDELDRLENLLEASQEDEAVEPLFVALANAMGSGDGNLTKVRIRHKNGVIKAPDLTEEERDRQVARAALLYGMLSNANAVAPKVLVDKDGLTVPDTKTPEYKRFYSSFFTALGRIGGHMDVAHIVLAHMIERMRFSTSTNPAVSAREYATVMERLIESGVTYSDPQLKPMVDGILDRVQGAAKDPSADKPWHEIAIDLPDLNQSLDTNVVAENVYLMGPMIFASMFEELKAFQVVDKLVELSQRGHLSLGRGPAGTKLYQYWREAPNRMSEVERQTFYAMTLGLPTGQPGAQTNSDFQDLWLRFVSSVSELIRESRVEALIRAEQPLGINQQQVKKAARDLVSNMSLHGYGMAYYAAVDLQKQINEMIKLLSDEEVRSSFGARDMWGVIDQIAQVELGGARNSSKYRTLATSGAIITRWLGDNLHKINDTTAPMIDMTSVENPPARLATESATTDPTDYDLVNACHLWLADSALDDQRVEQLSQPRESPQQPSRPIQMPSIARDLLEGTGLGLGMGHQRPAANGHDRSAYAGY